MWKYKIQYRYGTYNGFWTIWEQEEESSSVVIEHMWDEMRHRDLLILPMVYQSARVVDKRYIPNDEGD